MTKTVLRVFALILLTCSMTFASPATALTTSAEKSLPSWEFKRVTERSDKECWWFREVVSIGKKGAGVRVFLQDRDKKHPWRRIVRQTTLANGRFDMWTAHKGDKYKTKIFDVEQSSANKFQRRIMVVGDDGHKKTYSPVCTFYFA